MLRQSLIKIGKGMLIAAGAGAGTYFAVHYTEINFGEQTILFQGIFSVLIVAIKEYWKAKKQAQPPYDYEHDI